MDSLPEKDTSISRGYIAPTMRFCVRDLTLVIALILIGLIPLGVMTGMRNFREDEVKEAVLTIAGEEVWRCRMDAGAESIEYTAYFEGKSLTVNVSPNEARVSQSDCPDQICVHSGTISQIGQTAVCVPLRAVLRIESTGSESTHPTDDTGMIDAVAG